MDNFSQLKDPLRSERLKFINRRWKQLVELTNEAAKNAIHLLFLSNTGGAVATLSFIGAIGKDKIDDLAKFALVYYVLGIIFVGIYHAIRYHRMYSLSQRWQFNVDRYFKDSISWEAMLKDDAARSKDKAIDYIFPYSSFSCFILGSGSGFIALIYSNTM